MLVFVWVGLVLVMSTLFWLLRLGNCNFHLESHMKLVVKMGGSSTTGASKGVSVWPKLSLGRFLLV